MFRSYLTVANLLRMNLFEKRFSMKFVRPGQTFLIKINHKWIIRSHCDVHSNIKFKSFEGENKTRFSLKSLGEGSPSINNGLHTYRLTTRFVPSFGTFDTWMNEHFQWRSGRRKRWLFKLLIKKIPLPCDEAIGLTIQIPFSFSNVAKNDTRNWFDGNGKNKNYFEIVRIVSVR